MPFCVWSRCRHMVLLNRLSVAFSLVLGIAVSSSAPAADHVVVVGFERFHSGDETNAVLGGKLLLGELNCLSCHTLDNPQAAGVFAKQAPILDGVGSRV